MRTIRLTCSDLSVCITPEDHKTLEKAHGVIITITHIGDETAVCVSSSRPIVKQEDVLDNQKSFCECVNTLIRLHGCELTPTSFEQTRSADVAGSQAFEKARARLLDDPLTITRGVASYSPCRNSDAGVAIKHGSDALDHFRRTGVWRRVCLCGTEPPVYTQKGAQPKRRRIFPDSQNLLNSDADTEEMC